MSNQDDEILCLHPELEKIIDYLEIECNLKEAAYEVSNKVWIDGHKLFSKEICDKYAQEYLKNN